MTYNIPDHVSGDTWEGIDTITLQNSGIPIDLTDAHILMQFRSNNNNLANPCYLELSNDYQTISTPIPQLGLLTINPTTIDLPVGIYDYSLQITFPNGNCKTYLQGKWKILPNTTRSKSSKKYLSGLVLYFGADTLSLEPSDPIEILKLTSSNILNIDNGYSFDLNIPPNSRRIIIAYPDSIKDLTSVTYKDFMNMPILDKFTKKTLLLDRQTPYGIVKVLYKVYYYITSVPYGSSATYSVNI
jgi:hypothetical protein